MSKASANNFVPVWDKKSVKTDVQIKFEKEVQLHLLDLDLSYEQRETITTAFNDAVTDSSDEYFTVDTEGCSWISFNGQPVNPINPDIKPFFDEAIIKFEDYIQSNWSRLMDERKSAILVKANSSLFAAYKSFFMPGISTPPITCFGNSVAPSNPAGVNINALIKRAVDVFRGMILNQGRVNHVL